MDTRGTVLVAVWTRVAQLGVDTRGTAVVAVWTRVALEAIEAAL